MQADKKPPSLAGGLGLGLTCAHLAFAPGTWSVLHQLHQISIHPIQVLLGGKAPVELACTWVPANTTARPKRKSNATSEECVSGSNLLLRCSPPMHSPREQHPQEVWPQLSPTLAPSSFPFLPLNPMFRALSTIQCQNHQALNCF